VIRAKEDDHGLGVGLASVIVSSARKEETCTMSSRPIEIRLGEKAGEISPLLYGVFFEDINYGADGGLYGELLKNRSFEFFSLGGTEDKRLSGWTPDP